MSTWSRTPRGWSCLSIKYQVFEDTWKTPAESSRRHSDQGDRRTPVTISYTSVSFVQLHRPWGCSRQLAHTSQQWGWSKTWDQTFVWVSKEINRAVILAYYFMIRINEELPCELGRTAPLCRRGQPRQPSAVPVAQHTREQSWQYRVCILRLKPPYSLLPVEIPNGMYILHCHTNSSLEQKIKNSVSVKNLTCLAEG